MPSCLEDLCPFLEHEQTCGVLLNLDLDQSYVPKHAYPLTRCIAITTTFFTHSTFLACWCFLVPAKIVFGGNKLPSNLQLRWLAAFVRKCVTEAVPHCMLVAIVAYDVTTIHPYEFSFFFLLRQLHFFPSLPQACRKHRSVCLSMPIIPPIAYCCLLDLSLTRCCCSDVCARLGAYCGAASAQRCEWCDQPCVDRFSGRLIHRRCNNQRIEAQRTSSQHTAPQHALTREDPPPKRRCRRKEADDFEPLLLAAAIAAAEPFSFAFRGGSVIDIVSAETHVRQLRPDLPSACCLWLLAPCCCCCQTLSYPRHCFRRHYLCWSCFHRRCFQCCCRCLCCFCNRCPFP